jgi:cell division protein FtsB
MMGIITIAIVSFAVLIIAIVIMASIIADQQEKLKRANQHIKALTAVYEETKKIREKTNATIKQLDSVDFCIDYLNGSKLPDDSAEG